MRESSKPADEHNAAAIAASRALPDSTIPRGTFAQPAAPSAKGAALLTRWYASRWTEATKSSLCLPGIPLRRLIAREIRAGNRPRAFSPIKSATAPA